MVDRLATSASIEPRWWLRVSLIWLATRVSTAALFLLVARSQAENYWTGQAPGYFEYLNIWDAEWFHKVFDHGYPVQLPVGADGLVTENEWAFMPGYPILVRLISTLTGLDWVFAAPLVATLASFGFALVAYRLIRLRFDAGIGLWSLVLIGLSPASAVLQAGYAESLGLLFLAAGLYFWATGRYIWSAISVLALSVTRPGAVAFGMAVAAVWIWRWWATRTDNSKAVWRERIRLGLLALVTGISGFLWFGIAWLVTGRFDAYLATELAWRRGYTGSEHLQLFQSWFVSADFWLGTGTGSLIVWALFGFAVWIMFTPSVRSLGTELRAFSGAYLLYLALVFFPQSSTIRILFPAFGVLVALASKTASSRPAVRYALIALALLLQLTWLLTCWKYSPPDYSPP
ncbi:MAG: hypothetical protein KGL41_01315 [Actinomycetales bacterium]|nr:hypothetical protein [Actinomycetales bacterium]